MALLARFACGCVKRVEIPAPPVVVCEQHGDRARLLTLPSGQVRYQAEPGPGTVRLATETLLEPSNE